MSVDSVSYTHLDVYKRQHTKCSRLTTSGRSYEDNELLILYFKVEILNSLKAVRTVSYTHLDVYKRQVIADAEFIHIIKCPPLYRL